ncbi:MAG TPA: hypothetical protein VG406_12070 [Isosphaeraceae bacterium]|jgi:hypothetical protein|nr:hypothetical protein [Isosphaeraceae bacterium]
MRRAIVWAWVGLIAVAGEAGLETLGRLDHPAIREASGIVGSRKYPGIFWVHNDSGNPPALFAVRRDGTLVREFAVGAANIDWEDIANDDEGHLYLGEIGNNNGRLPFRAVLRLDEPDPSKPADTPLKVTLTTHYRFPPGGRFDAEALVIDRGRALILAKTFDKRPAGIYAIPLDPPATLLRPALPERVGTLDDFPEPVTGADLSADGRRLAVCSYAVARVYARDRLDDPWKPIGSARFEAEGIEAICWDGPDLILVGEGRGIYRIGEDDWKKDHDRGQRRRTEREKPNGM